VSPCASSQLSLISDFLPWNLFQGVGPCASPQLFLTFDLLSWCPACESLCFSVLSLISGLLPWNSVQIVSHCASSQLCLWSLTSCHEILFRVWVPVLLLSSVSDFWSSAIKSHPACVSLCFSSALSLISDLLFRVWVPVLLSTVSDLWPPGMKFHSACEFLCFSSALSLISDLLAWNPVQRVSPCASPQLCFLSLTSCTKFHPACESLCFFSALSLISDLLSNPIQHVSPCASLRLCLSCHEILSRLWVCASPQVCLWSLTSCHEISFRVWVPVLLLRSVSDIWPLAWNPVQSVSPCASPQLPLISDLLREIPSSLWVPVLLPSSIFDLWSPAMKSLSACKFLCFSSALLISDLLPWNPVQDVSSCASAQLCFWSLVTFHLACKSLLLTCLSLNSLSSCVQFVPVFFHLFSSPYSVNRPAFVDGKDSGCCGCSIQCKLITHFFQFLHLLCCVLQFGRCLPCQLLLVWSYSSSYIFSLLTIYAQPFLSVLNIPSGLHSKAPIPVMPSSRRGTYISNNN